MHGHSVGGTNPSLLEAMASSAFIIAHKNAYNASVLKANALYFDSVEMLHEHFKLLEEKIISLKKKFIKNNMDEIKKGYNWQTITNEYVKFFNTII